MASNINADSINSNYPVAGTNNSTQGFRDNFTLIKNNLNYAKAELSDLQSKAILKSGLSGQTLNNDMSESVISNAVLKSTGYSINDLGVTSGSIQLDFGTSTYYLAETSGSLSLTFTEDWPTAGICGTMRLVLDVTNISHKLTLPNQVSQGLSNLAGLTRQSSTYLYLTPATTITASLISSTPISATGFTLTSGTARITFATRPSAPFSIGSTIILAGFSPTSTSTVVNTINTTFTVSACTTTYVEFALTGTYSVSVLGSVAATVATYTVSRTQDVGSATNLISFTGTSSSASATFTGYIAGSTLFVTTVSSGSVSLTMSLSDTGAGAGFSTITFATVGTYVFDFETVDHGTTVLVLDQSRATDAENITYSPFSLPPATTNALGGIKVGTGLSITAGGILTPSIASSGYLGAIKVGAGLTIAADGTLSVTSVSSTAPSPVLSSSSAVIASLSVKTTDYNGYRLFANGSFPNQVAGTYYKVQPQVPGGEADLFIRAPATATYRFVIKGTAYWTDAASYIGASLKIYVNGAAVSDTSSSLVVVPFNSASGGSIPTPITVTKDISLNAGDKIELYLIRPVVPTNINPSGAGVTDADLTVWLTGGGVTVTGYTGWTVADLTNLKPINAWSYIPSYSPYTDTSGSGAYCYLAGSKIAMADGSIKNIEDVQVNEFVLGAFGEINQVLALKQPLLGTRSMFKINGEHDTTNEEIYIASNKSMYAIDTDAACHEFGKEWECIVADGSTQMIMNHGVASDRLHTMTVGVDLHTINGPRLVDVIEEYTLPPETQLYNFVLSGSHSFFVNGYAVVSSPNENDFDYDTWTSK